ADPVPEFLAEGRALPKPYGAEEKLHYSVHAGRAKEATVFGLVTTFDWTGRRFGLTTELDLIPLDRTKRARPSAFHGGAGTEPGTPAFVPGHGLRALVLGADGRLREGGKEVPYRSGVVLTGRDNGSKTGMLETTDGSWLPAEALLVADRRDDPLGFA